MQISEQGLALIRRFEGFAPLPYRCPAGVLTIGYGHAMGAGEKVAERGISRAEGEALLLKDAARAAAALKRYVAAPLNQNQADALISFIFNVGAGAFSRSTLRRIVNRGWHEEVPEQLMRWVHSGGVKQPGLVERRKAEAEIYCLKIQ